MGNIIFKLLLIIAVIFTFVLSQCPSFPGRKIPCSAQPCGNCYCVNTNDEVDCHDL